MWTVEDTAGRQDSTTDPLGRTTRQSWDTSGNLATVTDPSGGVLNMSYDTQGRLIKRTAPDGTSVSFSYDKVGQRASMTDASGTTRYSYDKVGRLLNSTRPDGSVVGFTYDLAGRRTAVTYPDGLKIGYTYNGNGWLTGLSDPRAGDVSYTLDADGRTLTETLPGKWARSYSYDGGLLSHYSEDRAGSPVTDTTLKRDADGRIIEHVEPTPGKHSYYTYDPAGQLLTASGEPGGTMTATYDAVGNRTSITRGNVTTAYTYDAADQITAADTGSKHVAYTYDSSGRLLDRKAANEELTFAYNPFGQPATITQIGSSVTQTEAASYDGDGLLTDVATTRQPVNNPPQTTTVHYRWSQGGGQTAQLLTQTGEGAADFVYGYGRVFADTTTGSATFSRDAYGSALSTSDTTQWVQAGSYDIFGDPTTAGLPSLSTPAFGYRGELSYRGETGIGALVYLRSRTYDATAGRFTSRDPATTMIGQTDTVSPYAYANNAPLNFTDPDGRYSIGDFVSQAVNALLRSLPVNCPPVNDSIEAHNKCFHGVMLSTRGFIPRDCLDARQHCLESEWNKGQRERAAQAFTLNELAKRREGGWDRFLDDWLGFGTTISDKVDWEVKPPRIHDLYPAYPLVGVDKLKIDMVTDDTNAFEVKDIAKAGDVMVQLGGYISVVRIDYGIPMVRGTELMGWASSFMVRDDIVDYFTPGDQVYVWGDPKLPGQVYFGKDDKVPARVKNKADRERDANADAQNSCPICGIPLIPIISRVPIEV